MKIKKESNLKSVTIAQQFKSEIWRDWDKELILSQSIHDILTEIVERVSRVATVIEAYGILHDKDTSEYYNPETNSFLAKSKENHGHFLLKFSDGATLSELASAIGIETQYLEKARSGRYSYDSSLSYLCHFKDSDKFLYSPNEVVTIRGKDYLEVFKERYASWSKGRSKKDVKKATEDIDPLISKIISEEITKNEILLDPKYYPLYSSFKTRINEAFITVGEIKSARTKQALENGEFKKTILFITGGSDLGKSSFAKEIIASIIELSKSHRHRWSSVKTAGTNIFDQVNGEEILFLDDVRGNSLTASDWLKLLDPYNISPISARYQNRMGSARVIIITSTKHPIEFFYYCKGNDKEDLSQFIRRIDSLVTIYKDNPTVETRYFQASPKMVSNRNKKVPNTDAYINLTSDFENNSEMKKLEILELLLAQTALNNNWELNENIIDSSSQESEPEV